MNRNRLLVATLVASLVANGIFVGFAAKWYFDGSNDDQRSTIIRTVGARLTKNLDEKSRERVALELDLLVPLHQENLDLRRENYRKLRQLLAQPVVDKSAVDAVSADMKTRASDLVFRVHEKAIDAILELPADTRLRIADPQ